MKCVPVLEQFKRQHSCQPLFGVNLSPEFVNLYFSYASLGLLLFFLSFFSSSFFCAGGSSILNSDQHMWQWKEEAWSMLCEIRMRDFKPHFWWDFLAYFDIFSEFRKSLSKPPKYSHVPLTPGLFYSYTNRASVSPKVTAICTKRQGESILFREKVFCFCIPLSLFPFHSNSVQFKRVTGIEIYELGTANMCSKSSNPSPLPIFLTQSILLCFLVVDLLLIVLMVDALQKFHVVSWVECHHLFFLCLSGWNNTGTQSNDQQQSCTIQTCKYMK